MERGPERRTDRRTDPWADFLRRMLLSAGLASAAVTTTAGADTPPAEVAEAEPQQQPELPTAKG